MAEQSSAKQVASNNENNITRPKVALITGLFL